MTGGQFMVVLIVLIAVIGGVFKHRHRHDRIGDRAARPPDPEAIRLRDEVRTLKERIAVLERVVTDHHTSVDLDRQIERLRDQR